MLWNVKWMALLLTLKVEELTEEGKRLGKQMSAIIEIEHLRKALKTKY